MQVKLLVERGLDECIVKLAGANYKFKRNEAGALVAEVFDLPTIAWVSDPRNTSFIPYDPPIKVVAEVVAKTPGKPVEIPVAPPVEPVVQVEAPPEEVHVFDEIVDIFATPETAPVEETPVAEAEISGGEKFPCVVCGKVFTDERRMKSHIGGAHKRK